MAERLAEAPWRNCCWPGAPWRRGWPRCRGETVAGRGADADGWGLPGRDATIDTEGVAEKEWQRRSGSEGVAVKAAGGVLILIKNSVALGKYLGICWIF